MVSWSDKGQGKIGWHWWLVEYYVCEIFLGIFSCWGIGRWNCQYSSINFKEDFCSFFVCDDHNFHNVDEIVWLHAVLFTWCTGLPRNSNTNWTELVLTLYLYFTAWLHSSNWRKHSETQCQWNQIFKWRWIKFQKLWSYYCSADSDSFVKLEPIINYP